MKRLIILFIILFVYEVCDSVIARSFIPKVVEEYGENEKSLPAITQIGLNVIQAKNNYPLFYWGIVAVWMYSFYRVTKNKDLRKLGYFVLIFSAPLLVHLGMIGYPLII